MTIERKCISIFIPVECESAIYSAVCEYYRMRARLALAHNDDDDLYDIASKLCGFKRDVTPPTTASE